MVTLEGEYKEGLRWCIRVNPGLLNYCAYVGIPINSIAAKKDYDSIPVSVHGGWTFGGTIDFEVGDDKDWWWYGWDYAHYGDYIPGMRGFFGNETLHEWTLDEVKEEVMEVLPIFDKWLWSLTPLLEGHEE